MVLATAAGAVLLRDVTLTPDHYVILSIALFLVGALGVMLRRNAIVMFMCVEIMLNAANLAFVAFGQMHRTTSGQAIALFVIVVATAEVAVGLALIVSVFRYLRTDDTDVMKELRW